MTYYTERVITVSAVQVFIRTSHHTHPTVTVSRQGDIIVRGPSTTTDAEATALVERRRSWIYRQLTRLAETAPDDPLKELVPGSEFDVLGQPHRLRIIPDDEQEEPSTRLRQAHTGAQLTLRHTTALNPNKAQRTIINFYATTGQEWLKTHHDQIAAHAANQPLTGSFSTRMRTTWARNHPTRGLTLHWATAQLPPTLLRELIRRTLNLPTIASNHDLNNALRRLWLGRLTTPDPHLHLSPQSPGTLHTNHKEEHHQ
ncbi:YgjP-like metallopeptidase domain-containing protein [Streptomyces kanamyceticus]|uniref:YgjP-like metallopeptidase domain-containing protein n=1 Tax=Streptomyces kanamyceticus TaxID=1967 RepID=UPI0037DCA412